MRFPWRIEVGIRNPPEVRGEVIALAKLDRPFRALYMSDLHFQRHRTESLCDQLREIVAATRPELVLLGGDLLDKHCGLPQLSDLIAFARRTCLVGATGGNHDRRVGIAPIRRAVEEAGGVWLDGRPLAFSAGATRVVASASLDRAAPPADVSIHCTHYPNSFGRSGEPRHDIVFAGHLHGCQCTVFAWQGRLYPGAWFYRWNGLRFCAATFRDVGQPRTARRRAAAGELLLGKSSSAHCKPVDEEPSC